MSFFRHNAQQLLDWPADKEKLSVHRLAMKYKIPYTTLYKRINNWVTGYEHQSGGRGNSRILPKEHEGKPNQITGPACSIGFKLNHVHPL